MLEEGDQGTLVSVRVVQMRADRKEERMRNEVEYLHSCSEHSQCDLRLSACSKSSTDRNAINLSQSPATKQRER